mmetsp:Transcript_15828/g.28128  ORF Transcript_15828/g.28128 Transcript_15828/m.28128 type:complete len:343 (-) Transcript_15828:125-1153(-)
MVGTIPVQKHFLKQPVAVGLTMTTTTETAKTNIALPDDFVVDKDARYTGTVTSYSKWRGFGHIELDQKGIIPGDSIFIHWQNIQTEDRYPRLYKDLKVEFGMMIWMEQQGWKKVKSVRAKTVTLPGGAMVNVQDEMDAKKEFVGGQHFRYTGMLKFYDPDRQFGWVKVDDGFAMDDPVPKEIKVEESEVHCGGKKPKQYLKDTKVEFGIQKTKRGDYQVYNMTLPEGIPITQENVENRQEVGGAEKFAGSISWYSWRQGWGHIAPDPLAALPPLVSAKLDEMALAAKTAKPDKPAERLLYFRKTDCEWGAKPEAGKKVTFSVYVDDKGAGAKDVAAVVEVTA